MPAPLQLSDHPPLLALAPTAARKPRLGCLALGHDIVEKQHQIGAAPLALRELPLLLLCVQGLLEIKDTHRPRALR